MHTNLDLFRAADSPVHRLDGRVKLLLTVSAIMSLSLYPAGAWPAYILMLALIWSAAILSGVGVRIVIARSLAALPFLLTALPLLFAPGPAIAEPLPGQFVSVPGFIRFCSLALRVWMSVQAAALLTATTKYPDLLNALRAFRAPGLLVSILSLMWRYLFLFVDEAARLLRARSSRSGASDEGGKTGGRLIWRARVAGGMAGNLFVRSLDRSDRVYSAMLARGYTGRPLPGTKTEPLTKGDRLALVCGLLVMCGLLLAACILWR